MQMTGSVLVSLLHEERAVNNADHFFSFLSFLSFAPPAAPLDSLAFSRAFSFSFSALAAACDTQCQHCHVFDVLEYVQREEKNKK